MIILQTLSIESFGCHFLKSLPCCHSSAKTGINKNFAALHFYTSSLEPAVYARLDGPNSATKFGWNQLVNRVDSVCQYKLYEFVKLIPLYQVKSTHPINSAQLACRDQLAQLINPTTLRDIFYVLFGAF
ncbi:hypothetical protein OROGR_017781 [Orobanche gracilis]